MKYKETTELVRKSIKDSGRYNFRVTMENGGHKRMRLFVSSDGSLCEFKRRSRSRGHCISCESWQKLEPVSIDTAMIFKRNVKRIIQYLEKSGFWPSLLPEIRKVREIGNEDIEKALSLNYDGITEFLRDKGIEHISPDKFQCLCQTNCIKTVNWGRGNEWIKEGFQNALEEKRKFMRRWTVGYDNSIEYNPEGEMAWYSEEYRGFGNGHYYLLLDERHISFREDD